MPKETGFQPVRGPQKELTQIFYEDSSYVLSGKYFDDVSYKNAVVVDARGDDADDDVYTGTINSVDALNKALDKVDNYDNWDKADAKNPEKQGIVLDVCVEDGKITFIVVTAVMDAAKATEKEDDVDATISNVDLAANGTVTLTLSAAPSKTEKTNYKATISMWNAATAEYKTIDTATVTVDAGKTTGTADISGVMVAGTLYKVTIGGVDSKAVAATK